MKKVQLVVAVASLVYALPHVAWGQSATASLSGSVQDPQGRAVQAARVTITDIAKNIERETSTNGEGQFTFSQAQPSRYSIRVAHTGFATYEVPDVVLNVNDRLSVRVALQIDTRREAVVVTGDAAVVNESPAVGTVAIASS